MTAVDIFGPASSLNSVTARPSDGRAFTPADTFFKDCTTPSSQDGTQVAAAWLNQVTGVLRSIARANGLKRDGINPVVAYDQSDAMVLNGIEHLIQRGQLNYAIDQGGVDALAVVPAITPAELVDGLPLVVKIGNTNTGPATITLTGFSTVPVPIVKYDGTATAAGDLLAGAFASLRYDLATGKFRATHLLKSDGAAASSIHIGDDTGAAPSIVATVSPAITVYGTDQMYVIGVAADCSGATTANFNGLGTRPVKRCDGTALVAGDWAAHDRLVLVDDGTNLRLVGLTKPQIIAIVLANLPAIVAAAPSISPPRNIVSQAVAGTYTFTVPAGVTWLLGTVVGAGGGGAGGAGSSTWSGGGGGSGGTAIGWIAVTPGQVITYVVGAKGAGGAQGNGVSGGSGGTSSFGSVLAATGGGGGNGGTSTSAGGSAGVGSGGQINLYGAIGGDGNPQNAGIQGGAGAGSSQGGGGRTSTLSGGSCNASAAGAGGGGIWGSAGATQVGGNGADGIVTIQY